MPPLVSVSTATKNYARYLPMAIESVRAQTFTDWELVIVDDGSTDSTPDVVQPYLADRRIRYLRADRLGQTRAKNLGVAFSQGQFVAFLDADDVWERTKLEKQLAVFRANPGVGVVFCRRSLIDGNGDPIPARAVPPPPRGHVLSELFVQNFVCFSSALVRREILAHVGRLDPRWDLAIDFDLWLRVARHHTFDYVDEELVRYRTGHGNLSKKLLDRVNIAFSIMTRAQRDGVAAGVPREVLAEAYASTCRTIGYVLRNSEPVEAAKWYLHALRWRAGRLASVKGFVASVLRFLSGKRVPGSPENASANR